MEEVRSFEQVRILEGESSRQERFRDASLSFNAVEANNPAKIAGKVDSVLAQLRRNQTTG
jgi:hypothetical protein